MALSTMWMGRSGCCSTSRCGGRPGAGGIAAGAWPNLIKLARRTATAVAAALLPPRTPLLLTQPGLIDRYQLVDLLRILVEAAKDDAAEPILLLVPGHERGAPKIGDTLIPDFSWAAAVADSATTEVRSSSPSSKTSLMRRQMMGLVALEQLDHLPERQPGRLAIEADLDARLPVLGLVEEKLGFASGQVRHCLGEIGPAGDRWTRGPAGIALAVGIARAGAAGVYDHLEDRGCSSGCAWSAGDVIVAEIFPRNPSTWRRDPRYGTDFP